MKAQAGIFENDAPDTAVGKLDSTLPDGDERGFLRARLLPLIGVDSTEPASREESFSAWRSYVESIASAGPAVLVFEDLHWADAALLEFLGYLAEWAQGVPLMLVCTARPELFEANPAWSQGIRNATTINLAPLTPGETNELVLALLTRWSGADEVRQTIVDRAGGNPLYAEEFVRLLADRRDGVGWEFPNNVQSLIAARLDTLPPTRKALLQDAAVIGKVFWAGAVAAMGDRDPADVERSLHELSRKELVRPARMSSMEGEVEYAFWHALVRDVAYQQIPRTERALRHERAAGWIEQHAGERIADLAEVVAHHYQTALELVGGPTNPDHGGRLAVATRRYLKLAGERAIGLDAAQAERILAAALALTEEGDPDRVELVIPWATAALTAGRYREAAAEIDRTIATLRASGDRTLLGDALLVRADAARVLGDMSPLELVKEAVTLRDAYVDARLIEAVTELARQSWISASPERTIESADRAIAIAAEAGLPDPVRARAYRGLARAENGVREGLDEARDALAKLVAQGVGRPAAMVMANLGLMRWLMEGSAAGLATLEEVRSFADQRHLTVVTEIVDGNSVDMMADSGRTDEALALSQRLASDAGGSGDRYGLADAAGWTAFLLGETGDIDGASRMAEVAIEAAAQTESVDIVCGLVRIASVRLLAGEPARAVEILEGVLAYPAATGALFYGTRVALAARTAIRAGDVALAERVVDALDARFPMFEAQQVAGRAELAAAVGDHEGAITLFQDAVRRFDVLSCATEKAHAAYGRARCLATLGRPEAARALEDAHGDFARCGLRVRAAEVLAFRNPTSRS